MRTTDSLEHLAEFHEGIEELVARCERVPYRKVASTILSFIDFAVETQTTTTFSLPERERNILAHSVHDCIHFYKVSDKRKIGGKYFRHPFGVFLTLVNAGATSLQDLLLGMYHDVVEEVVSFEKEKDPLNFDEAVVTRTVLENVRDRVYARYVEYGYSPFYASSFASSFVQKLHAVTKKKESNYCEYVGNIYAPHQSGVSLRSPRRIKAADAYHNLVEVTTPQAMMERKDVITLSDILAARHNEREFSKLTEHARYWSLPDRHPNVYAKELEAPAWVKTTGKGIIVLYGGYRNWNLKTGRSDPVIENIALADIIRRRSMEAINHNLTYHNGGYPGQTTPGLVCKFQDELESYEQNGGFRGVTLPGSSPYDGLFLKILNTSLRGESASINSLEQDRVTMHCMLLIFTKLAELYIKDHRFMPSGFTSDGFVGSPAAFP